MRLAAAHAAALVFTLGLPATALANWCDLPEDQWPEIVAPSVDGAWSSETLSGLAFVEGEAVAMPERISGLATFRADGGMLFLAPPQTPAEFELLPAGGESWDLAMGGEDALPAQTVFDDPTFGFGLECPLDALPRYRTGGRLEDAEGGVDFMLYLVMPDADTVYAVTVADLDAPDGTAGVARVISRFTR
ncbi:hypothetical protein [Halodurantibacterium flavum]|uniref:Uncharacterized protein n=1 Tax=Halodurantibacterium flavum TaxID=1382802 RepID=A0ABW4S4N0_9RHOB